MRKRHTIALVATLVATAATARDLQPGFDITEYRECVRIASHFEKSDLDSIYFAPEPERWQRVYSAPVTGFDNNWELWDTGDTVAVVSLRGSVITAKSWISNFHAGMIPAKGTYHLGTDIDYDLSDDEHACVHAGWVGGLLSMTPDILHKLDSCYQSGYRNVILTGHSQGGGICYLLTAFLYRQQQLGNIPADIRFKTYCSAGPKPGDYAFACYYEHLTRGGWAFNVINAEDWVPEVPLSVQKLDDFRETNPFTRVDTLLEQFGVTGMNKFKVNYLFNKLNKPLTKSEEMLRKYLGQTLGEMLAEEESTYTVGALSECANYQRVGVIVVLRPDEQYYKDHPRYAADVFEHHMYKSYADLADRYEQ